MFICLKDLIMSYCCSRTINSCLDSFTAPTLACNASKIPPPQIKPECACLLQKFLLFYSTGYSVDNEEFCPWKILSSIFIILSKLSCRDILSPNLHHKLTQNNNYVLGFSHILPIVDVHLLPGDWLLSWMHIALKFLDCV